MGSDVGTLAGVAAGAEPALTDGLGADLVGGGALGAEEGDAAPATSPTSIPVAGSTVITITSEGHDGGAVASDHLPDTDPAVMSADAIAAELKNWETPNEYITRCSAKLNDSLRLVAQEREQLELIEKNAYNTYHAEKEFANKLSRRRQILLSQERKLSGK